MAPSLQLCLCGAVFTCLKLTDIHCDIPVYPTPTVSRAYVEKAVCQPPHKLATEF
ncbi:hypothetical protein P692DRAFT_201785560 [Suillus brevipes Sb2]|nr:hypothetical protein P692DRAFT_201785560 [Suillus brevipes Sb2]